LKRSKTKSAPTEPHPYSIKFREQYGRTLTREEIRLVQAYRGLRDGDDLLLLKIASDLVLAQLPQPGNKQNRRAR